MTSNYSIIEVEAEEIEYKNINVTCYILTNYCNVQDGFR